SSHQPPLVRYSVYCLSSYSSSHQPPLVKKYCFMTLVSISGKGTPLDVFAPQEVKFHSLDYRSVLHWKQHANSTKLCPMQRSASRLLCDLSQETSDPREWNYARVRRRPLRNPVFMGLNRQIQPQKDIVVRLKPPHSPHRRPNGSWISVRKLQRMSYTIHLMHNDVEELLISGLRPWTTYCLQAESQLHLLDRRSTRSPRARVTS
ncbi:unnamed protein product, partial [Coregonus sp. 'balchen']